MEEIKIDKDNFDKYFLRFKTSLVSSLNLYKGLSKFQFKNKDFKSKRKENKYEAESVEAYIDLYNASKKAVHFIERNK